MTDNMLPVYGGFAVLLAWNVYLTVALTGKAPASSEASGLPFKVEGNNVILDGYNLKVFSTDKTANTGNLVVGLAHNVDQAHNSFVAGFNNTALGDHGTIAGGTLNQVSARYTTVSGGSNNDARGDYSAVSGGLANRAEGTWNVVSGGMRNLAQGSKNSVAGGHFCTARDGHTVALGGLFNEANEHWGVVVGGSYNKANGWRSTILGGKYNTALGQSSVVVGGARHFANGVGSVAGGGDTKNTTGFYSHFAPANGDGTDDCKGDRESWYKGACRNCACTAEEDEDPFSGAPFEFPEGYVKWWETPASEAGAGEAQVSDFSV